VDHQTKVDRTNDSLEKNSKGLAQNVSVFTHDVFVLVELQAQLLATDIKECRQHALVPGLILLTGMSLGAACFPIVLTALALWLVQRFGLSYPEGFLAAGVLGAMTSTLLCSVGWLLVRRHLAVLGRSKEALIDNVQRIKKVLERDRVTRNASNPS
jgi:Putative Actinobacterial Holin-X, holin superfamily III